MARVVKSLGKGGQRRAEIELRWNRRTIRKGTHELESGFRCYDNFASRGRKPVEQHLPNLLSDITAIAEAESQTDPTFKTTRLMIAIGIVAPIIILASPECIASLVIMAYYVCSPIWQVLSYW